MRLAVCALSTVLLSGCSWLGGFGQPGGSHFGQQGQSYHGQSGASNPCVILTPVQPVPPGCHPSQVTMGTGASGLAYGQPNYGGFPQKPDFSTYTTGGYGTHVADAGQYGASGVAGSKLRKPKLRGTFSMGFEKSISGAYLDHASFGGLNPAVGYNPNAYKETVVEETRDMAGLLINRTTTEWTGVSESLNAPTISFDDVHSTPFRIAGGAEYIMSPHMTVFGNVGYSHAEGNDGAGVDVIGGLRETVTEQSYAAGVASGAPLVNSTYIPNAGAIAKFNFDFSDMRRLDAEVGGRFYFDPVVKDQQYKTLTPFVSASAGLAHLNGQSVKVNHQQALYKASYDAASATGVGSAVNMSYYTVPTAGTSVQLYDSQIVPTGSLTAGMEWQVTPKTAFALETGLKYEGAREYSDGSKGTSNIAVPLTLRGSYNF